MSNYILPQITAKDVIKLGQIEAGEAPTGEWKSPTVTKTEIWIGVERCPAIAEGKCRCGNQATVAHVVKISGLDDEYELYCDDHAPVSIISPAFRVR